MQVKLPQACGKSRKCTEINFKCTVLNQAAKLMSKTEVVPKLDESSEGLIEQSRYSACPPYRRSSVAVLQFQVIILTP